MTQTQRGEKDASTATRAPSHEDVHADQQTANTTLVGHAKASDAQSAQKRLEQQARAEGLSLMQEESVRTLHDAASLASARKRQRHPVRLGAWIVFFLLAALIPYALGRWIAVSHTSDLLAVFVHFTPRGLALLGWMNVTALWITLVVAIISHKHRWMGIVLTLILFIIEQFVAGLTLLKWNFWNSTFVVFHQQALYPNAMNLGILASVVAALVFCIVYVILLVFIRPGSSADFLTHLPAAISEYLLFELAAILIVLLGGLLTMIG